MEHSLKNPYITVSDGRIVSYGGNQMNADNRTERSVGCGVIAALDLLLYLSRYHLDSAEIGLKIPVPEKGAVPLQNYLLLTHALRRKYLPLIPRHGINGLMLAMGVNACFLKNRLPFRASWGVSYKNLWSEIARMLDEDIPVVFSIGPNMPLIWQHHKLRFYLMDRQGSFVPGPQTHAHYVMITGMDAYWLRVSSWGRMYYIRRDEFLSYVKEHSLKLVCNILCIQKKDHGAS